MRYVVCLCATVACLLILSSLCFASTKGCISYYSDGTSKCKTIMQGGDCYLRKGQTIYENGKKVIRREYTTSCPNKDGLGRQVKSGCRCVVDTSRGHEVFCIGGIAPENCEDECQRRFGDRTLMSDPVRKCGK